MTVSSAKYDVGPTIPEGRVLRRQLRKVKRRARRRAFLLVLPLLVFMLAAFAAPLGMMLTASIYSPEVSDGLPETSAALGNWTGDGLPGAKVFNALEADMKNGEQTLLMKAVNALNTTKPGFRSLLLKTRLALSKTEIADGEKAIIAIDKRWADPTYWQAIKSSSARFTSAYMLSAFDLEVSTDGVIAEKPSQQKVYRGVLIRTSWMAGVVLFWCALIGYPIAYVIANAAPSWSRILLPFVLIPLWTSLLARTAAWLLLFQKIGVLNQLFVGLGIFAEPHQLLYTRGAVYVAMVHIMLPFFVLPVYAVMKSISAEQVRAAKSLGAGPIAAFLQVYLPQTLPGMMAGATLVFVVSLGFYITPSLIGGGSDIMVSSVIANLALDTANWPMASALALVLLLGVGIIAFLFHGLAKQSVAGSR